MPPKLRPSKKVILQVLWSGIDNSVPSLFLTTDSKRYLFNCGESIQRIFAQCKLLKLGRLDTFFMTSYEWSHMGGLPGFSMTLRDIKKGSLDAKKNVLTVLQNTIKRNRNQETASEYEHSDSITVYAPPGMDDVVNAAQYYMRFDHSGVKFNIKCNRNESFSDNELNIEPIVLDADTLMNSVAPSMCYLCQLLPFPGKFLPSQAIKLGVEKGPLFSQLTSGESVVLPSGVKVSPHQVMEPPESGTVFHVVDCPTEHHVESLQKKYESVAPPHLIIHLTPKAVVKTSSYDQFLKSCPSTVNHLFLCDLKQKKYPVFKSQFDMQMHLNKIDPQIFPLIEKQQMITDTGIEDGLFNFSKFNLRDLTRETPLEFDNTETIDATIADSFYNSTIEQKVVPNSVCLKRKHDSPTNGECTLKRNLTPAFAEYPKVVSLGTGAAIPSKYRNVSSSLLHMSSNVSLLLDCGEGTYGQLCRHYGDQISDVLSRIKFILVSHLHADHHMGLISLLLKIHNTTKKCVTLVGPSSLHLWLKGYPCVKADTYKFIPCKSLLDGRKLDTKLHVQSVKVDHPGQAHGFVVSMDDQKITYSGDTLPSSELIKAGQNSTLLIHEATMEDRMVEEAMLRKHSTVTQAFAVFKQMQAEKLLLTHFSQRYPKIPLINKELISTAPFALAFDHMEISLAQIPAYKEILPEIQALFAEKCPDDAIE